MKKWIAGPFALAALALTAAGCGSAGPAPDAADVTQEDGVVVQENWPDEVKQAEASFQKDAAANAQQP